MKTWDELTLPEQAAMMKVAVKNGIYNLQDIKAKYNEFAMGGDKEDLKTPSLSEAKRMGVMVGVTPFVRQKDYIGGSTSEARDKYWQTDNEMRMLTDSVASQYQINPDLLRTRMDNEGYTDARIKEINKDVKEGANRALTGEALFHSTSLPYVAGEEFGLDDVGTYINEGTVNLINENWGDGQFLNEHGRWTNMAMGHNYSDNVGIMAATLKGLRELAKKDFPHASDADLDRYASAYYNRGIKGGREWVKNGAKGYKLNKHSIGGPLVEAVMNEYANGGGIHIKHPGRLTALKKRTGKTEAELYNDGNPAHKKMVVFARNSRKWKHGLGGDLNTYNYGNTFGGGGLFGNETVDTVASFLPIVGTAEDAYQFYKDPSWANAGWLALSLGSDIFTGGMAARGIKALRMANKAHDAAQVANKAARRTWEAGKAANTAQSGSVKGADMRRMINSVKAAGATRQAAIRRANDALFEAGVATGVDQGLNGFINAAQMDLLPDFGLSYEQKHGLGGNLFVDKGY